MRIICLWNPDHLSKQTSLTSAVDPYITGFLTNDSSNYSLFSAHSMSLGYWSWNVPTFNGRTWLRVNCSTSASLTAYLVLCQATTATSYQAFRDAGTRYVYHGCRIYVVAAKSGATLLSIDGVNGYTVTNGTEYFVEVVEDLTTNTRRIWVNGASFSTVATGNVLVGSYIGSMLNASGHGFYLTDYYFAISEASDANPPVRLGKISVKTLPPTGMTGGDKFNVVGSTNPITTVLGEGRLATPPNATTSYVTSDSNGGVATLSFTAPTKGDKVIGASGRTIVIRDQTAQANAYADAGMGDKVIAASLTTQTTLATATPVLVPNPVGGWSEAELGNTTIKIWSKRSV